MLIRCPILALAAAAALAAGGLDGFHWREEFADAGRWAPQPTWLSAASKTASVTSDGQAACFRVDEPRLGMKWSASMPMVGFAYTPWLVIRYRAENLNAQGEDYLVYLDDRVPGKQLNAIRLCDVKSDGKWHVAAVEVSRLTEADGAYGLAVQVRATEKGGARLWLDWLAFLPEPPKDAEIIERVPTVPPKPDWAAPLAQAAWKPRTDWLSNPAAEGKHSAERKGDAWVFRVADAGRGMKWAWDLPEAVELSGHRYVALRYRATGQRPWSDYVLCVIGKPRGDGRDYEAVIAPSELVSDGRWHTVHCDVRDVAARFETVGALAIQVQAADPDATLEVADLRLVSAIQPSPLSDFLDWKSEKRFQEPFSAIPLGALAQSNVGPLLRHLRIAEWFPQAEITAQGIPFQLSRIGPIRPIGPIPPGEGALAGTSIREKGELRIPADVKASEVYLLLLAALIGPEEPCYGSGKFRVIRDVDRFRLRLEYADGTADECLPMQVASKRREGEAPAEPRFAIVPGPQVLVAAADPAKRLKALVLADRCKQAAFALAAVTARTAGKPGFPEAAEDSQPLWAPLRKRVARLDGEKLRAMGLLSQSFDLRIDGRRISGERLKPTAVDRNVGITLFHVAGIEGLTLGVRVPPGRRTSASRAVGAFVVNEGTEVRRVALVAPKVGPYKLCERAQDAYYLVPRRGCSFDNRACSYAERYCGLFPVQFLDTFSPASGLGLSLRTENTDCVRRSYLLEKKADGSFTIGVEYPERTLEPGESFEAPLAVVAVTDGDWHRGFEAYRKWLRAWHKPLSPRKRWFREIFNFRQRFLHALDPLYDHAKGTFHLQRAVDEARREFGGIDYLHIFDWGNCGKWGRIYGRTGDYSPYDFLEGGRDAFRKAIEGVQKQGVPTGLYIEGYLLTARGKLGQAHGKDWQSIRRDGKGAWWPGNVEMSICAGVKEWREVQASTYETKVKELGVDGMYIDQFGFANAGKDCWSDKHGHPVPSYCVRTERDTTKAIRERVEAAKKGVAIYTEETPVDATTPLQDGSFTYAMNAAQRTQTLVPLNVARFAFPDFKTIEILYCDKPTGSWATGVRWVFFNGEAIWLEGPAAEWFEPETRAEIRRCYRILRKHKDAFTSLEPVPLVPTEMGGVWANKFPVATLKAKNQPPVESKTLYTLYNARHRTVRGEVLRLPHRDGATYYDEWHQRPATVRRDGAHVLLATELGPHGTGCLVVEQR